MFHSPVVGEADFAYVATVGAGFALPAEFLEAQWSRRSYQVHA
jgi:hypothetical protein